MDGNNTLVDWGVKAVKGDKNAQSLSRVAGLVAHYKPNAIALESARSQGSRRRSRVQTLLEGIVALAEEKRITVRRFSRKQLNLGYFKEARRTKHALAEHLATRFPEELGLRIPKKRRLWMNEDYQMDIFDAVALAEHFLRGRQL